MTPKPTTCPTPERLAPWGLGNGTKSGRAIAGWLFGLLLLAGLCGEAPGQAPPKNKAKQPPPPPMTPAQKAHEEALKRAAEAQKKQLEAAQKQLLEAQKAAQKQLLEAQKKAAEAAQKRAAEAQRQAHLAMKTKMAHQLTSAYILLAAANNDYAGHKGRAMGHVQSAINILDAAILRNGQVAARTNAIKDMQKATSAWFASALKGIGPETQILSDGQVRQAIQLLKNAQLVLGQNRQVDAFNHVGNAIQELDRALIQSAREALKGKEAQILASAYVLLAGANHDYNGHRVNAMGNVKYAVNVLDANLIRWGSVDQKVKAMKQDVAAGVAQARAQGQTILHESQAFSDAQMMMAGVLIQQVALASANNNQPGLMQNMTNALTEISIALTIR